MIRITANRANLIQNQALLPVYTMRMGKGIARLLLLAIVVFWAAMPGFACLSGPAQHSCCLGMTEDCSSPAMTATDCCIVQQSPVLPGHVAMSSQVVNPAAIPTEIEALIPSKLSGSPSPCVADSPPVNSPATHPILRI
ncbi:MAG TPA: hypothetical protein VJV22_04490 [Acidobacteriaceae bacterium]|nr:hypothetical protein [Acidobacteriaceae bacterium]